MRHCEFQAPQSQLYASLDLLGCHILVGRQEHFEPGFFRSFQQFPIDQLVPSEVPSLGDGVGFEERNKWRGGALIKENAHWKEPADGWRVAGRRGCGRQTRALPEFAPASRRTTP